MKKLQKLNLAEVSKSNLLQSEMNKLYGGNYCAFTRVSQRANLDKDTCSCLCYGECNNNFACRTDEAKYLKYSGTPGGGTR